VACEAHRWSTVLGAELIFLHVGQDNAETRALFDRSLKERGLSGAQIEFRNGKPGKVILRAATELKADLIIAGALERENALTYFVGSVARQMARSADCSVLLITEPRLVPVSPRCWAVTVRFDDVSQQMLRFLNQVAQREKPDRIEVISEYGIGGTGLALESDLDVRSADSSRSRLHLAEEARLADFLTATRFGGSHVRRNCLRGRVGHECAEFARREGAELMFAPAPRRLGFWDKFIQQGVEFALESLPCALWLYRPAKISGVTF
jgi:hypothetical protein